MKKVLFSSAILSATMAKELTLVESNRRWAKKVNEDSTLSWKATEYVPESY